MFEFRNSAFEIQDDKILLTKIGNLTSLHSPIAQVQIAGENKVTDMGTKMVNSSEGLRLKYASHRVDGDTLTISQRSDMVEVETRFTAYGDTNALRIQTTVRNASKSALVLEEVSAFAFTGIPFESTFTRFLQGHHKECQPMTKSLAEWGLDDLTPNGQKRISFANVGSWSTKEELPQGILAWGAGQVMFQIECSSSWYYEISDIKGEHYLYLSGPNLNYCSWACPLQPGEAYTTPAVALSFGEDLNDVLKHMTAYRRHICKNYDPDRNLPTIFNEYMHLSWDSPTAERSREMSELVAKTGVEYYVIDCGWHNEEDCIGIHHYIGQWKESKARFPKGVRKTMDLIRAYGMKPGLWIEPEVVGWRCKEMIDYYDDDCFLHRNGKPLIIHSRRFLDYRHPKVRAYMSETIRFMVEDLSADYIKFDYNHDYGVGTDSCAFSLGSGLEDCSDAFWNWVQEMGEKYPHVVFEGCASGGMRMDYKTLSAFAMVSTSDQTEYELYPYIAGNILAAVLPEQAAVWSYPVSDDCKTSDDVSEDRIAINMVNSLLGRMHLASHLERLDEKKMAMVKEGIAYYNYLAPIKKTAVPYFPMGFTTFYANHVCSGLRKENKVYLAVWCMAGHKQVQIPIKEGVSDVRIAYPSNSRATVEMTPEGVCVNFPNVQSAVFLEIQLQE